jgi:competence protein ComEA
MRPRGSAHADAVSRRLEQLSAELGAVRRDEPSPFEPVDLHTHIRPPAVVEEPPPVSGPLVPGPLAPGPPAIPVPGRHAARRSGWSAGGLLAGRVALGPGQLAVLAVVVALALATTAWWVLRDGGRVDSLTPVTGPGPATGPASATGPAPATGPAVAPSGSPSPEVVVDVTGKVRHPGIVVLQPGARVVDALDAAGGARRGADLAGLNLARLLVDGEQIVVGVPPPPGPAASAAGSPGPDPGALVNLNTASPAELEELPGVGPVTAKAIVDWRTGNGGFRSVDQLLDVDGIGEKTLADLAPLVTV